MDQPWGETAVRRITLLGNALLVTGLSLVTGICGAAEAAKPVRILWAGSSSLYYHNAPKVLAEWLGKYGSMPAVAELVGRSGTGVHVYLRPGFQAEYGLKPGQTVLDKIAQGRYDYVMLQVPAEFIHGPEGEEHDRSLDVYCRAIREAGGKPVFYEMGWGQDEKADVGRQKIFAAAVRNRVTLFAPCSTAWQRVRKQRSELALQNPPDTAHPGTLGLYLNLCCFYATFTGKPPEGMPGEMAIWRHVGDDEKKAAKERLKTVQFDQYDAALPGWMKVSVLAAKTEKISDETAAFLRTVAWEECQAVQKRLREATK
jgi:hypothetical protein